VSGGDTWSEIADWWVAEVDDDPAYREIVLPLLLDILEPHPGLRYLDAGCGEGRVMRAVIAAGGRVVGVDATVELLAHARRAGPVVVDRLPRLAGLREASFDGAYLSLVIEHLDDERSVFAGLARVVRPGGVLALVMNHPAWTAPDSAPVIDEDGEPLWRPGGYFGRGWTDLPSGPGIQRFHHRTTADLLTAAAAAGWDLRRLVERGVEPVQIERYPILAGQEHIPRLLGARWTRRVDANGGGRVDNPPS
jgi:SAM-dependent methyltransferase